MHIDPSKALVTFTLEGLFVVCKNDKIYPPRWEIGVPYLGGGDNHQFTINIYKITGSGNPIPIGHTLDTGRNIVVSNDASAPLPVEYFPPLLPPPPPPFNGPLDVGDPHDYRWIIDLEDRRFHHGGVEAKPDLQKHYKLKIFIDGGKLYTVHKSVERYQRFRRSNPAATFLHLGKLAVAVGIDLPRDESERSDRTVIIRNEEGQPNEVTPPLEQETGVRYEVRLKNVCPPGRPGTDFEHYYDILRAKDGTQFDILTVQSPLPPPRNEDDPTTLPPRGGDEPQVCNVIVLGQTVQLPGI